MRLITNKGLTPPLNAAAYIMRLITNKGLTPPLTTPTTYFAVKDHLGSVLALSDGAGNIVESYRYDACGRTRVYSGNGTELAASAVGNRYCWQGREYSFNTGLYYFRARWYDPVTGRWLSNDPIGIAGGLNQYESFDSNPVDNSDPYGEDIVLENTPAVNGWHRRVAIDSPKGHYGQSFGMSDRNAGMIGSSRGSSAANPGPHVPGSGVVYPDVVDPVTKEVRRFKTTPQEDAWALQQLHSQLGNTGPYNWLTKSCRTYAKQQFKNLVRQIKDQRKKVKQCP